MDDLKQGIHLRAYAQQDPVVAFRMESYDMFDEMTQRFIKHSQNDAYNYARVRKTFERKAVAKVTATSVGRRRYS